jgi:hypothetical protein
MTLTRAGADQARSRSIAIDPRDDEADLNDPGRPRYVVPQETDGGVWRGPTEAAWTTRILRGTPPPRQPTGLPGGRSDPPR